MVTNKEMDDKILAWLDGESGTEGYALAAAATIRIYAEALAIVREIAASDPITYAEPKYDSGDDFRACRYCLVRQFFTREIPHRPDCLWVRARVLAGKMGAE